MCSRGTGCGFVSLFPKVEAIVTTTLRRLVIPLVPILAAALLASIDATILLPPAAANSSSSRGRGEASFRFTSAVGLSEVSARVITAATSAATRHPDAEVLQARLLRAVSLVPVSASHLVRLGHGVEDVNASVSRRRRRWCRR
ncbi:hypothetical protein MTO96_035669 [Rhipicephalus appendiculatus]